MSYTYDVFNRIDTVTDPSGHVMDYDYDTLGNLLSVTEKKDVETDLITTMTYDWDGRILTVKDPIDSVTTYTYNGRGLKTAMKVPVDVLEDGTFSYEETYYTYDEVGNLKSVTDPEGYTRTYGYDEVNNLQDIWYPQEGSDQPANEHMAYDANNNMTHFTDRANQITRYGYDFANRLITVTDPDNYVTKITYRTDGLVQQSQDQEGNVTAYDYYLTGSLKSETNAMGQVTSYSYDGLWNLNTITTHKGVTEESIASMSGNHSYEPVMEEIVLGYTYYLEGSLKQEINADGTTNAYVYDAKGNLSEKIDEQNLKTVYGYDLQNNLNVITYNDSKTVSYKHNNNGYVTEMTDWLGTTRYTLDLKGRIKESTDWEGKTTGFTWNGRDQKVSMVYPDESTVTYAYYNNGNLKSVTDGHGDVTAYAYDVLDRLRKETLPNGNVTDYDYNSQSRVTHLTTQNSAGDIILDIAATYDGVGNKLTEKETALKNVTVTTDMTYNYDGLNQLISSEDQNGIKTKYFYDTSGNRIRKEIHNPTDNKNPLKATDYTYDKGNKITWMQGPEEEIGGHRTSDPVTFTYDKRGNLTKIQSTDGTIGQYYYNAAGKMTYAINKMGIASQYTYDGEGRRVKQAVEASNINVPETSKLHDQELLETLLSDDNGYIIKTKAEINYVIDPTSLYNQVLMTFGDHTLTQRYTYGLDVISIDTWHEEEAKWADVSQNNFEETLYYVQDMLGSTRALIRDDGKLGAYYSYDAFGTPQEKNHVKDQGIRSNIYHYAGYIYDYATSLYFVNARYLTPEIGRFVAEDPYRGDGLNRYAYVKNNPLRFVDPSGYTAGESRLTPYRLYELYQEMMIAYWEVDPLIKYGSLSNEEKEKYSIDEYVNMMSDKWRRFALSGAGSDDAHKLLEAFGWVPGAGTMFDGANAVLYLMEGKNKEAGISTLAIVAPDGIIYGMKSKLSRKLISKVADAIGNSKIGREIAERILASNSDNAARKILNEVIEGASELAFKTGKEGEEYLLKTLGGESQKYINTPYGRRFIDVFSDGVAHESKVGYASLTDFVKKQIQKDVYARDVLGTVDDVVWHFFESGVTGKQGPSGPLMDYLIENGIEVILH